MSEPVESRIVDGRDPSGEFVCIRCGQNCIEDIAESIWGGTLPAWWCPKCEALFPYKEVKS